MFLVDFCSLRIINQVCDRAFIARWNEDDAVRKDSASLTHLVSGQMNQISCHCRLAFALRPLAS